MHTHGKLNWKNEIITSLICEGCIKEVRDNEIRLLTATIDGKSIAYSNQTEFLVQIGKGKSAYRNKYRIRGNLAEAIMYYKGINIGNGYKKRLISYSLNKPVLAREIS